MTTSLIHFLIQTIFFWSLLGCNESSFSGSDGDKSSSSENGPTEIDKIPPKLQDDDCIEGDKLNVKWAGSIKECLIVQGRTFNFDTNICMNMRKAKFECDWDNIKSEMKKLGIISKVIESDSKEGAKLISCGQSKDENRIVAQWVKLPVVGYDCKATKAPANITTGCYTMYVDDAPPPEPKNEKEKMQQVADCMDSL